MVYKKYDLHLHSYHSKDSLNKPRDIAKRLKSLGFSGFALTDHGNMQGHTECAHEAKKNGLDFIPACEFNTLKGEVIGYFVQEMINTDSFCELCDQIHSQGGFAVLPHPYDPFRKGIDPEKLGAKELKSIDGIEGFNARTLSKVNNSQAFLYASSRHLLTTAGSDAHFIFELGAGYAKCLDKFSIEQAFKKKALIPAGKSSPFYVHGPTTLIKWGKRMSLLK